MNAQNYYLAQNVAQQRIKAYQRDAEMARAVQQALRKSHWVEIRNAVANAMYRVADAVAVKEYSQEHAA